MIPKQNGYGVIMFKSPITGQYETVTAHRLSVMVFNEPMVHCHKWNGCRERERHFLFNDALNTFYLRLYGVRHVVKDHSDSEKGNPLSPHRLLLSINSKGSFICTIPHTG